MHDDGDPGGHRVLQGTSPRAAGPVSRSLGLAPLGDGAEPTTMLNVLPSVSEV